MRSSRHNIEQSKRVKKEKKIFWEFFQFHTISYNKQSVKIKFRSMQNNAFITTLIGTEVYLKLDKQYPLSKVLSMLSTKNKVFSLGHFLLTSDPVNDELRTKLSKVKKGIMILENFLVQKYGFMLIIGYFNTISPLANKSGIDLKGIQEKSEDNQLFYIIFSYN